MLECETCETELSEDQFYFRKDTQKYHKDCKRCQNKKALKRKKNGLVKKQVKFDFVCLKCKTQKTKRIST